LEVININSAWNRLLKQRVAQVYTSQDDFILSPIKEASLYHPETVDASSELDAFKLMSIA